MKMEEEIHDDFICDETEDCKKLLSSLGDYVDGDLSPQLCAELEKHMKGCRRCRIVVDTVKKTVELYQETADETQIPADVRERLYLSLDLQDYMRK
jgi:anti-sigma factor RsiW